MADSDTATQPAALSRGGGRPLQPSTVKMVAQYLALLDPRCDFPDHNLIAQGGLCPFCKMDLFSYIEWVRSGLRAWPL